MHARSLKQIRQVICMKWGSLYGPEYVNRLYAMVRHHLSAPMRFVCLTDNRAGVRPEVECHDYQKITIPFLPSSSTWRKIALFAPAERLFGLSGDWLYLDLDVVISGPLDDFFTYQPEKSFIVMYNWTQPGRGIGNTSVYRFRVGTHSYLLDNLLANHKQILANFRNSQTYISRNIKEINFWPDKWCALFKVQCVPPWPQRFWKTPLLPEGSKIIAFPGRPNPPDALAGKWPIKKHWYEKIYNVIRPTPWIQEIWERAENSLKESCAAQSNNSPSG